MKHITNRLLINILIMICVHCYEHLWSEDVLADKGLKQKIYAMPTLLIYVH